MAPEGVIFPLTVSEEPLNVPFMPFLANGIRFQGSIVAPRHIHRRMLEFAARHGIKPMLMKFPMTVDGIEDAMQTLRDGKMRYRGVVVPETKA